MPGEDVSAGIVRFGVFQADLRTRELHKNGIKVPLQGQPFQVFAILLESAGELVTREELRQRVWPEDTFVDFDHALNTAITKIRGALGDDADNPRFVETLPRRGYRFIAPFDKPRLPQVSPTSSKARWSKLPKSSKRWAAGATVVVVMAAIAMWRFVVRQEFVPSPGVPRTVPLSSYSGDQCCPSFSPDGNQVTFVWTGSTQANVDIYIKLVGTEHAVRLTTDTADDFSPTWSPDGRSIAFLRTTGKKLGVFLVSPLGGPERKLTELSWSGPELQIWAGKIRAPYSDGLSWSRDSRYLAASDGGINLVSVETGEKRRLTFPPRGRYDDTPSFSPDGRTLVFSRFFDTGVSELYSLNLSRGLEAHGEPQQLTFLHYWSKDPVWTSDGHEIIFSSGPLSYVDDLTAELWRMPVSLGKPSQPYFTGVQGVTPTLSPQRNRLAYMRKLTDINIWRFELTHSKRKASEPTSLISSTHFENGPQYSPDGKRVVFHSTRSGTNEIWVASADGSNAVQLTSLGATLAGAPRWSPNGREIVFDSTVGGEYDVYTIDANGGKPRRLTDHPSIDAVPSYSRDGRWIYFLSRRSGRNEIWKVPASGGQALRVTQNGGYVAFESTDGSMLYYAKNLFNSSLWRMPVSGGQEIEVLKSITGHAFAVARTGIYFERQNSDGSTSFQFLSFATGKVSSIATVRQPLSWGMSVSPDERYLLYSQIDRQGSDLMMIENFR
jgi:Tol biopolymer transport system component/DNA-binding winged helix-turn-helix (wHTH) protein